MDCPEDDCLGDRPVCPKRRGTERGEGTDPLAQSGCRGLSLMGDCFGVPRDRPRFDCRGLSLPQDQDGTLQSRSVPGEWLPWSRRSSSLQSRSVPRSAPLGGTDLLFSHQKAGISPPCRRYQAPPPFSASEPQEKLMGLLSLQWRF